MNEQLTFSKSSPVKARFYDYQHFTYPWHFHSEYEIIYIKQGSGTAFIGNNAQKFKNGDIFLTGSNLPHYLKSDDAYYAEKSPLRAKGTIIQFEKEFMHYSINYYPQFIKIKQLLEESEKGIYFRTGCSDRLIELLDKIPSENGMEQITDILLLLKEMSEISSKKTISSSDFINMHDYDTTRINKILSFINSNYTRNIQLNEIASVAAMNPSAFCRFFKKETGRSLKNYVLEMKVGYACKLLLMDKMSISQISLECGFEAISYFNKTFRKHIGMTPTNYKKMMLNG